MRSKQYRKLMSKYALSYGFRSPYQVLIDAEILQTADANKMDLVGLLSRTVHGDVKILISQCCIRALYEKAATDSSINFLIDKAKTYERRRCGHTFETHPTPLTARECITECIGTNRHHYILASQDLELRQAMRKIKGTPVPMIYINRSVMIMEPMAVQSQKAIQSSESAKMRAGLRKMSGDSTKRKRDDEDKGEVGAADKKKKKVYGKGPKGPNPLSVKKKKDITVVESAVAHRKRSAEASTDSNSKGVEGSTADVAETAPKRKRRRKHNKAGDGEPPVAGDDGEAA